MLNQALNTAGLLMPRPDGVAAGWAVSAAPVSYPEAVAAMQAGWRPSSPERQAN